MRKYLTSLLLALSLFAPTAVEAQTVTRTISAAGSTCSPSTRCAVFGVSSMPSIGVYVDLASTGILVFEATIDGTNWFAITDDVAAAGSATADGAFFFSNPGYSYIRLRASAIGSTATVVGFKGFSGLKSTATLSGSAQGDGALQDGANSAIEATIKDLTNSNPLTTAIVDANGDQITSFGGGTQYTNAAAQASPTGTGALGYDGTNVRMLKTNSSGNLEMVFASAQAVTQSGTWNVANTGTFATQAAQSGTWTVQPGNTANTTPWLTSISQGGNTAAVNASGQLSITCANCSGSGASSSDNSAWTFGTTSGAGSMFVVDDTSTNSVTENSIGLARMTASRIMKVTLTDASGSALSIGNDYTHDAALTIASTAGPMAMGRASAAAPTDVSGDGDAVVPWYLRSGAQVGQVSFGGVLASVGAGVNGTGVQRFTLATDDEAAVDIAAIRSATESAATSLDNIETNLSADAVHANAVIATGPQKMLEAKDLDGSALPNAVTEGQAVRAAGSLNGVQYTMLVNEDGSAVGSVAQSGTWTVQPGNTANTTPWLTSLNATAAQQGCTPGSIISAASVNETEIKGSAGQLYMLNVTNIGAAAVYFKIYNDTAANTDENDTPIGRFVIPGATTGAGNSVQVPAVGMAFSAGITFRITSGIADNSTGGIAASEVLVSYCYK